MDATVEVAAQKERVSVNLTGVESAVRSLLSNCRRAFANLLPTSGRIVSGLPSDAHPSDLHFVDHWRSGTSLHFHGINVYTKFSINLV